MAIRGVGYRFSLQTVYRLAYTLIPANRSLDIGPGLRESKRAFDKLGFLLNAEDMDRLRERVLEEQVRVLRAKYEIVQRQRDNFVEKFHHVTKTPYEERREIVDDLDREIETAGTPKTVGTID